MATGTIKFITWNINGLKEQRNQKFRELQNADVVFLQETHIGENDDHVFECNENEWQTFFTKYTSSQRGTAILVRSILDFEHISDDKDTYAGYVVLKCKLNSQLYTLVSVYNHQTDTKTLDKLSRYLQLMTTGLLVIGGDFNTVLNPFIDKKCHNNQVTTNRAHNKLLPCVENFMKSLQLVDVWRWKHPVEQNYTFCRSVTSSRLDFFFIPEECLWCVTSCDISDAERPDHQPLSLEIHNIPTIKNPLTASQLTQNHNRDFRRKELELSLVQENSHTLSEVDIISAVNSLQVSETRRPDNIPVSFYKQEIRDVIPYIKMLYSCIIDDTLNLSDMYFNESVRSPHVTSQHFFNVDYLILATILARRLEDFLESQSQGRIPKDSHPVLMTARNIRPQTILRCLKEEQERQTRSNSTLSQDFRAVLNLVGKSQVLPCQGCPLTPVLITSALKCFASKLFCNVKEHKIYIFKQSVIVCVPPEDLDNIHAVVRNSTDEEFNIAILSRGNDETSQIIYVDSESESCDRQLDGAEFSDEGSDVLCSVTSAPATCQTSSMYTVVTLQDSDELMEAASDWLNRDKTQKSYPQTQNSPLSQATTSEISTDGCSHHTAAMSHGIKRKRDESTDISSQSLPTTDLDIRNKVKQMVEGVTTQVQAIRSRDHNTTALTHIVDAISKFNKLDKDRRKATIGIFGRTGVGKSSLINAVLGERCLLPISFISACTSVITQVEANLSDSQYKAEIEFISKEDWEHEMVSSETNRDGDSLIRESVQDKIVSLYGAEAAGKTLNELKKDEKYIEIDKVLSNRKITISNRNMSDFIDEVTKFIKSDESSAGGWFWPLVKSLTIKIPNCGELLENIVLLDIPGTGDCNKIRDRLWRDKLKDCTCVWIVNDINRALSDKDPWEILDHCLQDLGGGGECKHITFIFTKTDHINTTAYMHVNKQLKDQLTGAKDLKTKCILHRNSHAKEAVRRKLNSGRNRDSKERFITDVFTVSSEAFLDEENPVLESADSEIPKLREVLKDLNNSISRELSRDYVNEAKGVLSLIQSVQLDKDENKTKSRVYIKLQEELQKLGCRFNSLHQTLERCLSAGVEESVRSCEQTTQDMIESVRPKDNRGFHKIFRALCGRNGHYWPKNWEFSLDLNACLASHMYDKLNEQFELMFPNVKSGKSLQEDVQKFSITQSDAPQSSWQQHSQNFIKTQEYKLKASLNRYIVDKKKEIYSSVSTTIQKKMTPGYMRAREETGPGSMKRMETIITDTIRELKNEMFSEAKVKVLQMFDELTLHVMNTLESELRLSVERSRLHAGKIIPLNVSREIEELEGLSEQLSV